MLGNLFGTKEQETEEHWVSISDVMAGLMVIFLFIAISYMLNVRLKADEIIVYKNEIESLINAYTNLQVDLSEALTEEFEGTLSKRNQFRKEWRGYLDMEAVSVRFKQPFLQGEATVSDSDEFAGVLRKFFPRYVAILTKTEYRDAIAEVRVEGHTSSEWGVRITSDAVARDYIENMRLSQNRARNVLHYVLKIEDPRVIKSRAWLRKKLIANGLSSSQLSLNLGTNRARPSNSYGIVVKKTGIPIQVVEALYLHINHQIRNWQSSENLTLEEIIKAIETAETFSIYKSEALERAVSLLMENREDSRRVEFRVITKSEKLIDEIEQLVKRFNKSEIVK